MGWQMGLDRLLADRSRSMVRSDDPDVVKEFVQLILAVAMTYQEYNDRRNDIVNAYNNGEMNLPDLQYELAKLDRDYESNFPTYTVSD